MTSNQIGMSLIEVLLALFLVSTSAVGFVKLHTYVETKSDWANHATKALYLAESKLERFTSHGSIISQKMYSFETINQDPCFALERCRPPSSREYLTLCQSQSTLLNGIELKIITVEVCWQNRHGNSQSVALTTSISKFNEFSM